MTFVVNTTIVRTRHRVVATYASLRVTHGRTGDVVTLNGFASDNDGGQGQFWWEEGVTSGHNIGTIVVPTLSGTRGRWRRLTDSILGLVSAAWFGATGVYDSDWNTTPDANSDAIEAADAVGPVYFTALPGQEWTIYQLGRPFAPTPRKGVVFSCDPGVVLYHTNTAGDLTAPVVYLDGGDSPAEEFSMSIDRAILRGAPSSVAAGARCSKHALRCRGVNQLELRHVDGLAVTDEVFRMEGCTSITPFHVRSSVNVFPDWWDPIPVDGFVVTDRDGDPADRSSTMSVAINMIMEGMSGAGFVARNGASQWMLLGGTLEACGIGAHIEDGCGWFVFDNMQHVDNRVCDYQIDGFACEVRAPVSLPLGRIAASVDAAADTITTTVAHGYSVGDGPLVLKTTGTMPANLATATPYWVQATPSSTSLKLAASSGGSAIDIGDAGSGTLTLRAPSVMIGATARANTFTGGYYYGAIHSESIKSQRYEIMIDAAACVSDDVTIGTDRRVWVNDALSARKRWVPGALPEYADNASALAGGLEVGHQYRTGADVKVVI
jgi:hypothetical protein